MNRCAPLQASADVSTSLASALASLDCQLNAAVSAGYGRFFGHGGLFATALTVALTIYVAVVALRLLTGHTRLTLQAMTPRVLALGLVLTFATAWPAYQTVVFDLLARGPDQIATALLGSSSGATHGFAQRLDEIFDRFTSLAQALETQGQSGQLAARWVWAATLLLMLATAGLLLVAKIVLAILLALGPLFLVFALFGGTRGLFEGWLKVAVAFALAPLFVVLGGTGAIAILMPMVAGILDDPSSLSSNLRPVFMLFMGTVIYAATLFASFWAAVSVTRTLRVRFGREGPAHGDIQSGVSGAQRAAPAVAGVSQPDATRSRDDGGNRIAALVTAVVRNNAATPATPEPTRVSVLPSRQPTRESACRVRGLGQTQRMTPAQRGLSRRVQA